MLVYLQAIETEEDKGKFERIYIQYRGLMFYVAMRILHNEHDAEDAVHQAFLSILENLERIADVQSPETRSYIVIIAERKAIDLVRAHAKIMDFDFDETIGGIEIPLPGDHALADAMAQLPVRYRQVLLLRYDNGYSTKEIAKMFHLKRESVQKLLWRAKETLRKLLEKGEDNE